MSGWRGCATRISFPPRISCKTPGVISKVDVRHCTGNNRKVRVRKVERKEKESKIIIHRVPGNFLSLIFSFQFQRGHKQLGPRVAKRTAANYQCLYGNQNSFPVLVLVLVPASYFLFYFLSPASTYKPPRQYV